MSDNNRMMSKRNILFCIDSLTYGGAEKLLIDVLRKTDHTLFAIDLCVLSDIGVYFDDIPAQVHRVGYEDCKQKQYDVEVAFMEGHATQAIALRQSAAVKIAWVHTDLYTNHYTVGYAYNNAIEEAICYCMMDQIVFVSQTGMRQFDRLYPGISVNRKVIYNLIDREEIIKQSQAVTCPMEKTKLTLCSIGRFFHVKGFDRLIPMLSGLKKEGFDFHYRLIGDGPQKELLSNLIERYGLEDTVFLPGFQSNPYPYLTSSDVFVSVSLVEGLPLVIGEAMCLGKPVVATNVSGTAELLDHGNYGLLVETDDESVYRGLKAMMSDESLRTLYARKAETGSMTDIFDIQKNIRQINDLLYHTVSVKTPLDRIAHHLYIDSATSSNPGLMYGNMGKAIFFFHCAAFTGNKIYEDYAMALIDEMIRLIYTKTPADYENGLAGIGVGIAYLVQHQFIEGSANEILEDFDRKLRKETLKEPVSHFGLLNGYMGYARYWMFRLNNPENTKIRKNSRIIKSLDHILSVIDTHLPDIESPDERLDIYRFLCDLKQTPSYSRRAGLYLAKYFEANDFHKHAGQNFSYLKPSPVNEYIRERLNRHYLGIPVETGFSQSEINRDAAPHLLNGIISDGLFLLTSGQQDSQWISLL